MGWHCIAISLAALQQHFTALGKHKPGAHHIWCRASKRPQQNVPPVSRFFTKLSPHRNKPVAGVGHGQHERTSRFAKLTSRTDRSPE